MEGLWGYDDHFVLTLNNRVLAISQASLLNQMTAVDNSYEYDWDAIKDQSMDFNPNYWVLGGLNQGVQGGIPRSKLGGWGGG